MEAWAIFVSTLIALFASCTNAQDCVMEDFEVQDDFDVLKFLGKWYEIKWIPETYIDPEDNYKDFVWRQSLYNSSYIHIESHGRVNDDDAECISDTAGLTLTEEAAKFIYYRRYNSTTRYQTPFWVILTDYQHYYFSFGCRELSPEGVCVAPDAWVWSRTPELSEEYMEVIDAKIAELCLTQDQFVTTEQNEECPYESEATYDKRNGSLSKNVNNLPVLLFIVLLYISTITFEYSLL